MGIFMILLGIAGMIVNANGWFIVPSSAITICFIVGSFVIIFKFKFKLANIYRAQSMFEKR